MRRRVLAGLPPLDVLPGTTVLICLMIGSTSFDGFSSKSTWTSIAPHLEDLFSGLGAGTTLSSRRHSREGGSPATFSERRSGGALAARRA